MNDRLENESAIQNDDQIKPKENSHEQDFDISDQDGPTIP